MLIKVKVFPDTKNNKITKKSKDSYKIKIKEKAERGKANEAVIDLFSQYFEISKKNLRIIKGWKQRNKIIEVKNDKEAK